MAARFRSGLTLIDRCRASHASRSLARAAGAKLEGDDNDPYSHGMVATAIVKGKVVRFRLSAALARAHVLNAGKTMTDQEAVAFVETRRRARALRSAKPYLAGRP